MIASVVATLDIDDCVLQRIMTRIARLPNVEIGEFVADSHRLPVAIDSPTRTALEETTRQLQEMPGVAFVDVVYVHFEDNDDLADDTSRTSPAYSNGNDTP